MHRTDCPSSGDCSTIGRWPIPSDPTQRDVWNRFNSRASGSVVETNVTASLSLTWIISIPRNFTLFSRLLQLGQHAEVAQLVRAPVL